MTRPTLSTAPNKSRGFTLIELMVVVTILVLTTALIMPRVGTMKAQRQSRAFVPNLRRIASMARTEAIDRGQTTMLTWDQSQNVVSLVTVDSNSTGISGSPSTTSSTPTLNSTSNNVTIATINVPPTVSTSSFSVGDNPAQNPDWELHFYADGTCEGGGVEFLDSGSQMHLQLNRLGIGELTSGPLAVGTESHWSAGDFERRQ